MTHRVDPWPRRPKEKKKYRKPKRKTVYSPRYEYWRAYYLANRERKLAAANDRYRRIREGETNCVSA
jgi:hypothetical protein